MEILKNIRRGTFGLQGKVFFKLFDRYIHFSADEEANKAYVEACAMSLNSISEATVDALCKASIQYSNEFLAMIGQPLLKFECPRDVLPEICPLTLIVPCPEHGDETVVHLELKCSWEVEHGMEWLIRNDKVQYVGAFEGLDEWENYSCKQPGNYTSG